MSTSNVAVMNSGGGAVSGDPTAERDINIHMTLSDSNFFTKHIITIHSLVRSLDRSLDTLPGPFKNVQRERASPWQSWTQHIGFLLVTVHRDTL